MTGLNYNNMYSYTSWSIIMYTEVRLITRHLILASLFQEISCIGLLRRHQLTSHLCLILRTLHKQTIEVIITCEQRWRIIQLQKTPCSSSSAAPTTAAGHSTTIQSLNSHFLKVWFRVFSWNNQFKSIYSASNRENDSVLSTS